jgi:SAM-dependent methyltransferase
MKFPSLDTYLSLCTQVYDISLPVPPADEYAFFTSYAQECTGPILEPMCGTGRFLLPMLKDGFDVEGFDASKHMLQALRKKAADQNLASNVSFSFVANFESSKKYGLIFIPSGSFNLITDRKDIADALKKFYDLLLPGGKLVIEIITLAATPQNPGAWRREKWDRPQGGFILVSAMEEPPIDNVNLTHCTHDLIVDGKVILSEQETFKIRLYSQEEFNTLLNEAGFSKIAAIKAFNRSQQPELSDKDIVFECTK